MFFTVDHYFWGMSFLGQPKIRKQNSTFFHFLIYSLEELDVAENWWNLLLIGEKYFCFQTKYQSRYA